MVSVNFFELLMDVVLHWNLALPIGAQPVNMNDAIFAAKFFMTLSKIIRKVNEPMCLQEDIEWLEIRDFFVAATPGAHLINNIDARGRAYIEQIASDIQIFVHQVFNAPFRPLYFSIHVHYATKGLMKIMTNLSDASCFQMVNLWTEFATFGYNGMGFTSPSSP